MKGIDVSMFAVNTVAACALLRQKLESVEATITQLMQKFT